MSYVKFENFGMDLSDWPIHNGMSYTVLDDNFPIASNKFGPRGIDSRKYMIDRCSMDWDGFCDNYSSKYIDYQYVDQKDGVKASLNEDLVRQSAKKRFCQFVGCNAVTKLVDPTNIDGPKYIDFIHGANNAGDNNCMIVCQVDPVTIDSDPLMDRVLQAPEKNLMLLKNIANTHRHNKQSLEGTKLGRVIKLLNL